MIWKFRRFLINFFVQRKKCHFRTMELWFTPSILSISSFEASISCNWLINRFQFSLLVIFDKIPTFSGIVYFTLWFSSHIFFRIVFWKCWEYSDDFFFESTVKRRENSIFKDKTGRTILEYKTISCWAK